MIFHPNKNLVFVVNEQSSSVTWAKVDSESGNFSKINKVSTLPDDYEGNNSCADIHIFNDGKYVYASNRGHNSIAIFTYSLGHLSRKQIELVRGNWPRNFTLTPDSENGYLLAANQKSDKITIFKRDVETGLLTFIENEIEISKPVCLKFFFIKWGADIGS
ncbi:MAG: lactonase family protein [Flammeovirgaceae bacterium]|nr:lactonase family protein [Flammeovirgaceae bacterium]